MEKQIQQSVPRGRQLLIEATNQLGQVVTAVGMIVADTVMCGGCLHEGVVVEGIDDFTNDTIAYAINEGRVLFDVIDGDGERINQPWRVIGVVSQDLARLRLMKARLAPGLVVRMFDGLRLIVRKDGWIGDGELAVASIAELDGDFVVEADHGSV